MAMLNSCKIYYLETNDSLREKLLNLRKENIIVTTPALDGILKVNDPKAELHR